MTGTSEWWQGYLFDSSALLRLFETIPSGMASRKFLHERGIGDDQIAAAEEAGAVVAAGPGTYDTVFFIPEEHR